MKVKKNKHSENLILVELYCFTVHCRIIFSNLKYKFVAFDVHTEVECPPPPSVEGGTVTSSFSDTSFGSTVTYTCHQGLRTESGYTWQSLTCQEDQQWGPGVPDYAGESNANPSNHNCNLIYTLTHNMFTA